MIKIHRGYVAEVSGASIMFTDIDIDAEKKHVLVSVEKDYGKFLSPERADYALVAMLYYGLLNRHDIICEAPVTEELLYNIREILIPTLVRSDPRNYPVKIQADIAPPLDKLPFAKTLRGGGRHRTFLRRRQFLFRPQASEFRLPESKFDAYNGL